MNCGSVYGLFNDLMCSGTYEGPCSQIGLLKKMFANGQTRLNLGRPEFVYLESC
jgi:hypothetical protein